MLFLFGKKNSFHTVMPMNDLDKYSDLIEAMRQSPLQEPSPDFIERVMAALPARPVTEPPRRFSFWTRLSSFPGLQNGRRASLALFLAGFFYLFLAAFLFWGLRRIGMEGPLQDPWLNLQPHIAFGLACYFFMSGLLVRHEKADMARGVRLAILFYLGFLVMNGLEIQYALGMTPSIVGFLSFTGMGFFLGFWLLLQCCGQQTQNPRSAMNKRKDFSSQGRPL
jgi:hypothetical protein